MLSGWSFRFTKSEKIKYHWIKQKIFMLYQFEEGTNDKYLLYFLNKYCKCKYCKPYVYWFIKFSDRVSNCKIYFDPKDHSQTNFWHSFK